MAVAIDIHRPGGVVQRMQLLDMNHERLRLSRIGSAIGRSAVVVQHDRDHGIARGIRRGRERQLARRIDGRQRGKQARLIDGDEKRNVLPGFVSAPAEIALAQAAIACGPLSSVTC